MTNKARRAILSVGALLAIGAANSRSTYATAGYEPTEADIGYLQDMSVHHLQALDMCRRILGRATGDSVQAAATEVLENQAMEVGQMRAWLADWGRSTVPPTTVMAWMGANQGAGMPLSMMPGYASNAQMSELSTLNGLTLGKRWLQLMRAHHVGGVMMANEAKNLASSTKIVRLANFQVQAQTFEIAQYDSLLSSSYAVI